MPSAHGHWGVVVQLLILIGAGWALLNVGLLVWMLYAPPREERPNLGDGENVPADVYEWTLTSSGRMADSA